MDETTAKDSAEIAVLGMGCGDCAERVREALASLPGVERLRVEPGKVRLEYYPQAVSLDQVRSSIEGLGYTIAGRTGRRGLFRRFLDSMIEHNEKTFGHERLDCCSMRKQ